MGQPTPPGDSPLFEGLGSEWNDIVGAIPEDRRAELAPRIKQRMDARDETYAPLKQWDDFNKSGITPEHTRAALNVFSIIENNPRQVLDTIASHLGLTVGEAQKALDTLEKATEDNPDDPRLATLQKQVDVLSQIALYQKQETSQQQLAASAEAEVNKELDALKTKYGNDVNEREVILRMMQDNMSAEDAHKDFMGVAAEIRKTRAAPMLMGGSGVVPQRGLDVTKLDSKSTKDLVAQMMQRGLDQT